MADHAHTPENEPISASPAQIPDPDAQKVEGELHLRFRHLLETYQPREGAPSIPDRIIDQVMRAISPGLSEVAAEIRTSRTAAANRNSKS